MPNATPAIAFVWAGERNADLDAELLAWFGERRRTKPPAQTRFGAFVAARPQSLRGPRR